MFITTAPAESRAAAERIHDAEVGALTAMMPWWDRAEAEQGNLSEWDFSPVVEEPMSEDDALALAEYLWCDPAERALA